MTPSEASVVLAFAARWDQRTVGEQDALAWAEAISTAVPNCTPQEAIAAVREHYATSADRIMPAHVTMRVKAARRPELTRAERPALPRSRVEPTRVRAIFAEVVAEMRARGETPPKVLVERAERSSIERSERDR